MRSKQPYTLISTVDENIEINPLLCIPLTIVLLCDISNLAVAADKDYTIYTKARTTV